MSEESNEQTSQTDPEQHRPTDAERDGDLSALRHELGHTYQALLRSGASDEEARGILHSYVDDTIEEQVIDP